MTHYSKEVLGICKPAIGVADWSSPILGTYPQLEKAND